jgi:hypothetical protein
MSQETVLREFRLRRERERQKAIKKYALVALLPGGDPKRDAFDYAINEEVGLGRYAEMCESRIRAMGLPETLEEEALSVCRQMAASASRHAIDLIDIRQKLIRRGINLGKPEAV